MIRSLLTPEAHRDPYVWAAVLLAHFTIGSMLWLVLGLWVILAYAAFEVVQAIASRRMIFWDSVLDWCAVALGAVAVDMIASGCLWCAGAACVACLCIAAVGCVARGR